MNIIYYHASYRFIRSETVNYRYVRLLGLPPAVSAVLSTYGWIVDRYGRLTVLYPSTEEMIEVELPIPPIRYIRSISKDYMMIVDAQDDLHIARIVNDDHLQPLEFRSEPIRGVNYITGSSRDIRSLMANRSYTILHNNGDVSIMTSMNLNPIIVASDIIMASGRYAIDSNNGIRDLYNSGRLIKIHNGNIVDMATPAVGSDLYILDSNNTVSKYIESNDYTRMIINPEFRAVRLLGIQDSHILDSVLIEDNGGNIYDLKTMDSLNLPVITFNPEVMKVSRAMKSAQRR